MGKYPRRDFSQNVVTYLDILKCVKQIARVNLSLILDPKRMLKKLWGFFLKKSMQGKIPAGKHKKIVITGGHSFSHTINIRPCHI